VQEIHRDDLPGNVHLKREVQERVLLLPTTKRRSIASNHTARRGLHWTLQCRLRQFRSSFVLV